MYDKNFEKIVQLVFGSEGGFSNHPNDRGGRTNYGVTQSTYNGWRRKKGLPVKDIFYITKEEAKQLYYEEFWKASGADKLTDPREAYILFDMAVNSSPYEAKKLFKQSNENFYEFLNNRKNFYKNLINRRPDQKVFEKGWMSRLKQVEDNANSMITNGFYTPSYANSITPFDEEYSGELKRVDNLDSYERERLKNKYQYLLNKSSIPTDGAAPIQQSFTREQIGGMTPEEFQENLPLIELQLKDGLIKPQAQDYSGYLNPVSGNSKLFSRELISQMSCDEYTANEPAIMAQLQAIGIPTNNELQTASLRGRTVYVKPYTRSDGTEVRGYYRSVY